MTSLGWAASWALDSGMEGWRDGGMEGWRDGAMEGWRDGAATPRNPQWAVSTSRLRGPGPASEGWCAGGRGRGRGPGPGGRGRGVEIRKLSYTFYGQDKFVIF